MSPPLSKRNSHKARTYLPHYEIPAKHIKNNSVLWPVPLSLSWPYNSASLGDTVNSDRPLPLRFSTTKEPTELKTISRYPVQSGPLIILTPVTAPELKVISVILAPHFGVSSRCSLFEINLRMPDAFTDYLTWDGFFAAVHIPSIAPVGRM